VVPFWKKNLNSRANQALRHFFQKCTRWYHFGNIAPTQFGGGGVGKTTVSTIERPAFAFLGAPGATCGCEVIHHCDHFLLP
jgi:hypothetical protein